MANPPNGKLWPRFAKQSYFFLIHYDLKLVTETEVKSENNFVIDFYRAGILSAIAAIAICWRTDEMQV